MTLEAIRSAPDAPGRREDFSGVGIPHGGERRAKLKLSIRND